MQQRRDASNRRIALLSIAKPKYVDRAQERMHRCIA